jgi:uncharacterized protein YuzE
VDSQEVSPGVVVDFDSDRHIVGIDIDNAASIVNMSLLDVESFPLATASTPKNNLPKLF